MDPFLESRAVWSDVHTMLVPRIRVQIASRLPAGYLVRTGERLVVWPEDLVRARIPEERREHFVRIFHRDQENPVAAIELLSYSNKLAGEDRDRYLSIRARS